MKGLSTAVLTLFLAATQLASLAAGRPDGFRPPSNLQIDPALKPVVERMSQASPTFRRQCRRLAAESSLQVRVSPDDQPTRASFAKARTVLTFREDAPVAADVYIRSSSNSTELIAHELEHIIEQLDRVDLAVQAGNGAVWKSDRAHFETRRAIETGRRVAREIMDGDKASESPRSASGVSLDLLKTLRQLDRAATPVSPRTARVSGDGGFVVFVSSAPLVPEDRNQLRDVYVTDLATGLTTLESAGPGDTPADGESYTADISGDGRYVVFESEAGNLTDSPFPKGTTRVFLRDRTDRITRLLTTNFVGEPADGPSWNPVISANGTAVAFESGASDLIAAAGDGHQGIGIYRIALRTGIRARVDVPTDARRAAAVSSMSPAISADGRYVAFASKADLTCQTAPGCAEPPDRNGLADVYIYDTQSNTTRRVSRSHTGADTDAGSYDPAISGDGHFVAFVSEAANLTRDSTGRSPQIYLHDVASGSTELISRSVSGRPGNGGSLRPALSFDGSTIAFPSLATNPMCEEKCRGALEDINLLWDVFAYDRRTKQTSRLSADVGEEWMENSRGPSIDDAGRVAAFGSRHPVDASDAAHDEDLFVVRYPRSSVSTAAIVPKR
jgi:Tol biopolymer transport system component